MFTAKLSTFSFILSMAARNKTGFTEAYYPINCSR